RILCSVESPIGLDQITIELTNGWQDVPLRPYATVAVSAIHATSANLYTTTSGSVVVVEPDILIDATTIANCFLQNGTNPLIHLANRFQDSTVNEAMVKGNIVGLIFGYLLRDTEASFDASYERATKQNATALTLLGSSRDMALRNDVLRHFTTLQREVRKLGMGRIHVEATFFSSLYGINGRLDALIDSPQPKQKQIIELKSGRAVTAPLTQYVDGVPVQSRVWSSNLAQAACYYLLMQSTDPELKVTQNILYSADAISPLRPVDVSPKLQRSIVRLRNRIAQIEWTLASGDAAPLRQMKQASLLDAPPFISSDVGVLERALASASPSERAYFEAYCLLIAREHMTARVGGTNPDSAVNGFASLWLNDLHSKEDGYSAIPFLVYDRFDRETKTAIFHPDPKHEMSPSSMREGDIVLLYKHSSDWTAEPLQQQIVRGALRKINATTVEIEIRSGDKQLDTRGYWAVESDLFESGFTAQYRSMARFMRAEPARRSLLLGQTRPRTAPCAFAMTTADLDNHQRDVLKMALEAQDYFLLQGPPGTGKTQKMLRSMLELLYKNTNQKILLLAYTNRAVVEICTVLESMKGIEFLKLGSADGLTNRLSCLEEFSRDKSVAETRQKIDSTRVFVSTISTALNRTELLAYKQFDIALVDEASQLLEPHLAGLLTLVRRFILIGDEKQLPAVITQPVEQTAVSDPSLLALGINDLRLSLFERLLQVCQQKGWSHAYAMLETQGRMHEKIQAFPSTRFYDGRLHTMKPEQTSSQQRFSPTSRDAVERVIATARVLFIPSKQETHAHTHIEEAANVA
ncbi:MAG TPA: AAA domain-containing protein, partial [Anaerolineae bacterium]